MWCDVNSQSVTGQRPAARPARRRNTRGRSSQIKWLRMVGKYFKTLNKSFDLWSAEFRMSRCDSMYIDGVPAGWNQNYRLCDSVNVDGVPVAIFTCYLSIRNLAIVDAVPVVIVSAWVSITDSVYVDVLPVVMFYRLSIYYWLGVCWCDTCSHSLPPEYLLLTRCMLMWYL